MKDKKIENIFSFKKEEKKLNQNTIIVDTREKNSLVLSYLYEKNARIEMKKLETGDYIIGSLVIERKRKESDKDGLMWFSDTANELLYEEYFHLTNIEKDFLPVFKRFYSNEKLRTCPKTGEVMEVDKKFL